MVVCMYFKEINKFKMMGKSKSTLLGAKLAQLIWKAIWQSMSRALKMFIPIDSKISLLENYSKKRSEIQKEKK